MTTKSLRRTRYAPTGELKKRGTRPLGETGLLGDQQPIEQLLAQVEKLLTETEVLSARFAAISDVAVAVNISLHINDILDVMVEKARHALGFDYCAIGLLDAAGEEYTIRSLVWPGPSSPESQSYKAKE